MKIDLTIKRGNAEQHLKLELPTSWRQIIWRHFIEITKSGTDLIKVLAILTDLDEELIRKARIHNLNSVAACLSFLNTRIEYKTPNKVLGYKVAPNLDFESVAQYIDLQGIIKEFKSDDQNHNFNYYPLIVATYAIDPYDFNKAEEIKDQFLNAPCTEVLAIGNFTLVKLAALNNGTLPTCPQGDTVLTRFKQGLRRWLLNLAITIRFYLWKKSLPLNERNYMNGR